MRIFVFSGAWSLSKSLASSVTPMGGCLQDGVRVLNGRIGCGWVDGGGTGGGEGGCMHKGRL